MRQVLMLTAVLPLLVADAAPVAPTSRGGPSDSVTAATKVSGGLCVVLPATDGAVLATL